MTNCRTQDLLDERVSDMVNEKTIGRRRKREAKKNSESEQERKELRKMELWTESGHYIYKCIAEFFLAEMRSEKNPEKYPFLDSHHVIPRAVGEAIKEKIKNREFSIEEQETLKKVNPDLTKKLPILCHRNFNRIFRGDCILTQVIWTLDGTILNANYSTSNMSEKTNIIEFMFYVAYYNGKDIEPDRISGEIMKKYSIVPYDLLRCFNINYDDIIKYLEDNFFYPRYDEYWDVWGLLERTFNKKTLPLVVAENERAILIS